MHLIEAIDASLPAEIVGKIVTSINVDLGSNQPWVNWCRIRVYQIGIAKIGLDSSAWCHF
jgi:hypothetical protein